MTEASQVNVDLLRQTMDHILGNQDRWDQRYWAVKEEGCGTSYCFAGWAVQLAGKEINWDSTFGGYFDDGESVYTDHIVAEDGGPSPMIADVAREVLGLNAESSYVLFDQNNSLSQLKFAVDALCEKGHITLDNLPEEDS